MWVFLIGLDKFNSERWNWVQTSEKRIRSTLNQPAAIRSASKGIGFLPVVCYTARCTHWKCLRRLCNLLTREVDIGASKTRRERRCSVGDGVHLDRDCKLQYLLQQTALRCAGWRRGVRPGIRFRNIEIGLNGAKYLPCHKVERIFNFQVHFRTSFMRNFLRWEWFSDRLVLEPV